MRQCRNAEWYLGKLSNPAMFFTERTAEQRAIAIPAKAAATREPVCSDRPIHASKCSGWKSSGQCEANPLFMHYQCPKSCSGCKMTVRGGKIVPSGRSVVATTSSAAVATTSAPRGHGTFEYRLEKQNVPSVEDHVDVYILTKLRDTLPSSLPVSELDAFCARKEKDAHGKLLSKIKIATEAEVTKPKIAGRLLCIVYCIKSKHKTAVAAVRKTWASKCDGFVAMSDFTEPDLPALNVPHEGKEEYNNIWQKVRSIWLLVYQRYRHDFEWFSIGGDDIYW